MFRSTKRGGGAASSLAKMGKKRKDLLLPLQRELEGGNGRGGNLMMALRGGERRGKSSYLIFEPHKERDFQVMGNWGGFFFLSKGGRERGERITAFQGGRALDPGNREGTRRWKGTGANSASRERGRGSRVCFGLSERKGFRAKRLAPGKTSTLRAGQISSDGREKKGKGRENKGFAVLAHSHVEGGRAPYLQKERKRNTDAGEKKNSQRINARPIQRAVWLRERESVF